MIVWDPPQRPLSEVQTMKNKIDSSDKDVGLEPADFRDMSGFLGLTRFILYPYNLNKRHGYVSIIARSPTLLPPHSIQSKPEAS